MEPLDYVHALIRRWPLIAVAALIGALFAFVGTDSEVPPVRSTYRATHTLLVTNSDAGSQSRVGTISFAQVPVFATTGEVPRRVAETLGYTGAPAALAAQVFVEGDPSTGTIRFSTSQSDPDEAVAIADGFADQTISFLTQQQEALVRDRQTSVRADADRLRAELDEYDAKIAEATAAAQTTGATTEDQGLSVLRAEREAVAREYSSAYESFREVESIQPDDLNLTTLERAQPVQEQSSGFTTPRTRSTRVPIAAALGALVGAGAALLVERLDARLRDRRKAEAAFGAPVIAELPRHGRSQRASRLLVGPDRHHADAEAYRSLRTSVTFMAAGGQPLADDDKVGVILVTSASPAEGKTTVAANLAAAFAETGRRVVVVNSDFRRPVISTVFVNGDRAPLPGGLAAIDRLDPEEFLVETSVRGVALLDLAPIGGTPGDLSRATVRLVNMLAETIDVIIVDTPPLSVTTEALEFVPKAKVVVLVGRVGRTTIASAERAGELARFGGAEQVAVALAGVTTGLRREHYNRYYRAPSESRWRRGLARSDRAPGEFNDFDDPDDEDAAAETADAATEDRPAGDLDPLDAFDLDEAWRQPDSSAGARSDTAT